MNDMNNGNEVNMQIRKFLKQVGVGSHQSIEDELKKGTSSSYDICIKLEINNKEMKNFKTIINN